MRKYEPFYTFSQEGEDVEIKVTAKRIRKNFVLELPDNWKVDVENKIIVIWEDLPTTQKGER